MELLRFVGYAFLVYILLREVGDQLKPLKHSLNNLLEKQDKTLKELSKLSSDVYEISFLLKK